MKGLQILTMIGGIALVGLGAAMAVTNPSQEVYEEYAVQTITKYLQEDLCLKAPKFLGNSLENQCKLLVDSNQSTIKDFIAKGTQRQDFIFFSIYRTDLSITTIVPFLPENVLPAYRTETVGAFQSFYTYRATEKS